MDTAKKTDGKNGVNCLAIILLLEYGHLNVTSGSFFVFSTDDSKKKLVSLGN